MRITLCIYVHVPCRSGNHTKFVIWSSLSKSTSKLVHRIRISLFFWESWAIFWEKIRHRTSVKIRPDLKKTAGCQKKNRRMSKNRRISKNRRMCRIPGCQPDIRHICHIPTLHMDININIISDCELRIANCDSCPSRTPSTQLLHVLHTTHTTHTALTKIG
jgi:hypothetical protein